MSVVHRDTIHSEHHLDFLQNVGSHGLYTELGFKGVGMVGFNSVYVDNLLMTNEGVEVVESYSEKSMGSAVTKMSSQRKVLGKDLFRETGKKYV